MLSRRFLAVLIGLSALVLFGCGGGQSESSAIREVVVRENSYASYPEAGRTYLSFSKAHGFQVNFIGAGGQAWLWYPGNRAGLRELWKRDRIRGTDALCWKHPSGTYNPVTQTEGGKFVCERRATAQRAVVADLPGDPFNLRSGKVPYRLEKCSAPLAFDFDRARFRC